MKNSKCKNILISIGIWLMVVTILVSAVVGAGYGLYLIVDAADKSLPIIDVVTVSKEDVFDKYDDYVAKSEVLTDDSIEKYYNRLYSNDNLIGKIFSIADDNETKPFTPDNAKIYYSDYCFESYIDDATHKVLNKLVSKNLVDDKGKSVKITPLLDDILVTAAKEEHEIINMKIFNDYGDYYVYLEFNVNLSSPCVLYHYDKEKKSLSEIYTFDNEEVVGIRKAE